jgi:hypothetical protein
MENLLQTLETSADSERAKLMKKIRSHVQKHFQKRRANAARDTIERLKNEGSYPFSRDPKTEIERIERRVFDVCTINISRHLPTFDEGMDVASRKLLLRMIREALTQNPSSVGKIIREVCQLPAADAKRFASLLEDVPLSRVIDASHRVAERLEFLKSFKLNYRRSWSQTRGCSARNTRLEQTTKTSSPFSRSMFAFFIATNFNQWRARQTSGK